MDKIMEIALENNLIVIEDAAQAIDGFFIGKNGIKKPLGSIGHLATFSFHETKNIISGEGGMLIVNDEKFNERAEIIWEKGTNRSKFFRGEVDKYGWVDIGSSFLPSDIIAAFLWAQIENLDKIQFRRIEIWNSYYSGLKDWATLNDVKLPHKPFFSTNNAHMFYLILNNLEQRNKFINELKSKNIHSVFHYQGLHKSDFFKNEYVGKDLLNCDKYSDCLVRLPFFFELNNKLVIDEIVKIGTI
jgi:dTDP-4-amino-4,6-dideoxygalactose transaminase